jgi:predicted DNA-binding transcriptional regulator YafY
MSKAERVFALLEALQDHPSLSGPQLARRVGVDTRTVRRDVASLRELGIPVEAERGPGTACRR